MTQSLSAVVPSSMDRPKRIAKRLSQIYTQRPLSLCQAVVAHMYFHKDWHALEQAVKAGSPGAPFLEDLSGDLEEIRHRSDRQMWILCEELGGIDCSADFSPPKERPVLDTSKRESQAHGRYHKLLAAEALAELLPTARRPFPKQEYPDFSPLSEPEIIRVLPSQIATWWSVNVPHQAIVAQAWAEMELDPDDRIALLRAGAYWGMLCMHYADTINPQMVMGVSFLFATRYATLCLLGRKDVEAALDVLRDDAATKRARDQANRTLDDLFVEAACRFLDTLARDDLPDVFRAQPRAFIKNAEACLRIFANPKSRRGAWNSIR